MKKRLPTEEEALDLLEKVGCSKGVIQHCIAVKNIALDLAKKLKKKGISVDIDLVKVGALLHDIGRAKTHSIDHVIAGSKIAKDAGLPKEVIAIIERHAGGGISMDEAERLGWPKRDYIPQSLEEKIVCYADKLVDENCRLGVENTLKEMASELGSDHPALERIKKLDEEMKRLLGVASTENPDH